MKRARLFLSIVLLTVATTVSANTWTVESVPNTRLSNIRSHTSDPDNLLDEASKTQIDQMLAQLEDSTTAEIEVVALKSVGDIYCKDFATNLFNYWKIGKASKDNGLLILMVEDQGKISFETGYGMEGVLPDAICMRIIHNDMLPLMKDNQYGKGMLKGVLAVIRVVKDPKVADEIKEDMAAEEAAAHEASIQKIRNIGLGYLALSILVLILCLVAVNKKKTDIEVVQVDVPKKTHAGSPVKVSDDQPSAETTEDARIKAEESSVSVPELSVKTVQKRVAASALAPYEAYKAMHSAQSGYTVLTVLFPLTMIFFYLWYKSRMRRLRTMQRACPVCHQPLKRMSERQEDAYLSAGQQSEEMVGSIDYDAWVCMACGHHEFLPYGKSFTRYQVCPSCGYKTYAQSKDRIVIPPTPLSPGKGERIYSCANCDYEFRKTYIIPMIILPPRGGNRGGFGGGDFGGGFGGGSFGGGMSGGGGATGGWR
ncbi:MAG: TPM domain-containing protein [Bacteroidota bacterium]|nr:TPM domain-containing protein [Bacteroidota bacterium]